MTLDELKQEFQKLVLGESYEREFKQYLKNKGYAQSTIDVYYIPTLGGIFNQIFDEDIFKIQSSDLDFLNKCLDEFHQGCLNKYNINGGAPRNCLRQYIAYLKEQIIPSKFTDIEKEKFLEIIQEVLDKVDELRSTGKTTGSMPTQFEKSMNEVLQNLDYVCNFSFGQGILSSIPFINFCPKNILNKDLVNGDKLSGRRGIYIGFGYDYNKQKLDLVIECGNNDTQECEAKNEIDKYRPNEWEYTYKRDEFGKIKDQIVKDFLNLVSEFNQIPIEYFKPKGAEVIQQTNKSANETNGVPPLNQILYGPPGTGKTYNTINKALEILGYGVQDDEKSKITLDYDKIKQKLQEIVKSEDTKALNLENLDSKSERELTKLLFDYYHQDKQIEFITFHQSFSYEEFVEGIKPIFVDENGEEVKHSKNMIYKAKNGIFKDICERASYKKYEFLGKEANFQISDTTRVWKISIVAKSEKKIREKILKHCFENNEIRIGWADYKTDEQVSKLGTNDRSSIEQFENASVGDMICVFESGKGIIRGVGVIDSEFYWDDENKDKDLQRYSRVRKVKWLDKSERDIYELSGNLTLKTFYPLNRVNAEKLLDKVKVQKDTKLIVDNTQKPFILIIDEINRGNISKILGELITLIEPSKRIGADEELRVSLPYSANEFDGGKGFGVPKNLYIIGTMNTADRSIALLDTALRRRFEFVEMMPDYEELRNIWLVNETGTKDSSIESWEGIKGDDGIYRSQILFKILTAINNRIEFLLDREHTIGHAFFFEKAKFYQSDEYGEWYELTLESLKEIFVKKIIPLLQEYFYDDYAKIDAVLNGNGMVTTKKDKNGKKVDIAQLFEKFTNEDFISNNEKKIYEIEKEWKKWKVWQFIQIYDSNEADTLKSQSKNFSQLNNNE